MYQIVLVSIYVMSAAPGERDAVFLRHIIGIEWPDQKKVSICLLFMTFTRVARPKESTCSICYMHAHIYYMYMCA